MVELADELGITKSQLMDEALSLFLKAVVETRQGRKLALIRSDTPPIEGSCELSTPSLALLEWTAHRQVIELSNDEFGRLVELHKNPPKPTAALKRARRKHKK